MDLSCGCSSECHSTRYRLCRSTRCGILAIHHYVESPVVRDDRVETQPAVDLVLDPVGRSDGVVPISAEDLLRSSRKVHRGLGVYGVGPILTVHPVLAPLAAQAVVLEVFVSGSAAVVSGTAVEQVVATAAVQLKVVALLTMYLVDQIVAVQVYIVSQSTVDFVFAFAAGESFVARSTVESVTIFNKDSGHRNAFDKVIAVQGVDLVHPMVPIIRSPFLVPPRSPSG